MQKILLLPLLTILLFGFQSCTPSLPEIEKSLAVDRLLPLPVDVAVTSGFAFSINANTAIYYKDEAAAKVANAIAGHVSEIAGFDLTVAQGDGVVGAILLSMDAIEGISNPEAYQIEISQEMLHINAPNEAGLFYAFQTMKQLLPLQIDDPARLDTLMAIGPGVITDYPRYAYRGSMLDVARHFFDLSTVKQYIDYLAIYKMNTLHLHLSDDQGWRIEIKSWPKLTEIGGQTQVGGGKGGFYTQEDYKEIVEYAAERFITIVPEIDMPGHTNAALAAYPELNCDNKARELYTGTQVGFSTFCTDKEVVYQFVDDVMKELAEITPGPYLHVGGDESHVTAKPDYIKFINRVQTIVNKYDKQLVGWDEVVLAELNDNAIAQYWSSAKNANMAAEKNLKVIMSPAKYAYLDMKYDTTTELGLSWAGLIEVDQGYQWDPAALEEQLTDDNILGVEAPLWSETVTNLDEIQYMIFPRLPGYAEIAWTPQAYRDWEDYRQRLASQQGLFEQLGINYYKSPKVPWKK
ncbi:MAG: family 20 glycosylhydrolase [Bacteroidota bacterium]